ncbi:MAG: hypothetical protein LBQ57_05510 [Spirochaetales bacterium]|nr:hypothetical protein [Spirochaetales bacterium]
MPVICVLFVCPGLYALGSAEKPAKPPERRAEISGIIRLVGNDPFARLLVSADDGKAYIVDESSPARRALHSLQGNRVRMEGMIRESPVYAGEKYLGIEYFIVPEHYDFPEDQP